MDCVVVYKEDFENIDFFVNTQQYIPIDIKDNLEWNILHPAYPHGNIPIPFFNDTYAMSVEGVWEALKLFNTCGVDDSKFYISTMLNLRRDENYYGTYIGHRIGNNILTFDKAYNVIYTELYLMILKRKNVKKIFNSLKKINIKQPILVIDDTPEMLYGKILQMKLKE